MPDDSLDILVRVRSETADGQKAVQTLESAKDATHKATQANEEHAHSFVHAEREGKLFHKLLHSLTEESPVFGAAIRLAISPVPGLMFAGITALHSLIEAEKEAAKAAEEAGVAASKSWGSVEDAARKVVAEIIEADAVHADWAKHVGEDSHKVETALDAEIKKLHEEAAAIKEIIAAETEMELKRLENKKAQGAISEEDYAAQKDRLEAGKRVKEGRITGIEGHAELRMTETVAAELGKALAKAKEEELRTQADVTNGPRRLDIVLLQRKAQFDANEAERLRDELAKATHARQEAEAGVKNPSWTNIALDALTVPGFTPAGDVRAQEELADAQTKEAIKKREVREADKRAKKEADRAELEMTSAQKNSERAHEEAKKKVDQLAESLRTLSQKAEELKTKVAADDRTRAEVAHIRGDDKADPIARTLGAGAAALDARAHGQKLDGAQVQALKDLGLMLSALHLNTAEMVNLIRTHAGNQAALANDVEQLKSEAERLRSLIKTRNLNTGG